jgi:hypothetical protein
MTLSAIGSEKSHANWSPELWALLHAVQTAVHGRVVDHGPTEPADLPALLALARRHRLLPLLERNAAEAGIRISEAEHRELKSETLRTAARNLLLSSILLQVMEAMRARGISALSYKGPVVAVWAYGELGLRVFEDLDVLVRRRDLPLAAGTLRNLGFRLHHPRGDSDAPLAVPTEYHFPFWREREGVLVELHCRLAPYYFLGRADAGQNLARVVPASVGFGAFPVLCVEDLLLALCFHGAKHAWQWLSMIADIALLIARRPEIDWDVLWLRAGELGARRMVLCSLALAERAFAVPVPAGLAAAAKRDSEVLTVTARAMAGWQSNAFGPAAVAVPRFHVRCFDRRRDRFRYVALLALAPNWDDIEWVLLPRALTPLYWLLRPLRLLSRRLPPLLRLLAGRPAGPTAR